MRIPREFLPKEYESEMVIVNGVKTSRFVAEEYSRYNGFGNVLGHERISQPE